MDVITCPYIYCDFCRIQVPKNPDLGSDAERVRKEEQKKIDDAEALTEEEQEEKEELLKQVWLNSLLPSGDINLRQCWLR